MRAARPEPAARLIAKAKNRAKLGLFHKKNIKGGCAMKRIGLTAALMLAAVPASAADVVLNETQTLGRRLFEQSCGICHTRPLLTARVMYGPELSRETAGGNEEIVRGVITDGTPRMPAFKYHFTPDQIAAIAAYLKVVPPGTQAMIPSLADSR